MYKMTDNTSESGSNHNYTNVQKDNNIYYFKNNYPSIHKTEEGCNENQAEGLTTTPNGL